VRLLRGVGQKRPVFQISQNIAHPGRTENGTRAHERASKTVQPTLLPSRSGICARGKERAQHSVPKRGPSPKQRAVEGWRICASAGAQSRQSKHSPGDPMQLNFGYHVRAKPLTRTTSQPSQGTPSALRVPRASDFPRSHARIDITTVLSAHITVALHPLHPTARRT
jgi:hypothetical protein